MNGVESFQMLLVNACRLYQYIYLNLTSHRREQGTLDHDMLDTTKHHHHHYHLYVLAVEIVQIVLNHFKIDVYNLWRESLGTKYLFTFQ